jgi:hypothetical protein
MSQVEFFGGPLHGQVAAPPKIVRDRFVYEQDVPIEGQDDDVLVVAYTYLPFGPKVKGVLRFYLHQQHSSRFGGKWH